MPADPVVPAPAAPVEPAPGMVVLSVLPVPGEVVSVPIVPVVVSEPVVDVSADVVVPVVEPRRLRLRLALPLRRCEPVVAVVSWPVGLLAAVEDESCWLVVDWPLLVVPEGVEPVVVCAMAAPGTNMAAARNNGSLRMVVLLQLQ